MRGKWLRRASPMARREGVKKRVRMVAKASPPAIEVESCVHHSLEGAPKVILPVRK